MRLELDGQDLTHIATKVRTEEEIGQRSTMSFEVTYPDGQFFQTEADSFFKLADGGKFLLSDGSRFKLESAGADPDDFMPVRVSHPDQIFRDVALHMSPWLYWPLDEGRGLAQASDIASAGRHGTWSTVPGAVILRNIEAEAAAVPYGAAPRFVAGAAPGIVGPPLTGLGLEVTLSLFIRVDTTAAGSARVVWGRVGPRGLGLTRDRVDGATQRISWLVGSRTVAAEIPSGEWVWVVARRSGAEMTLWVDGVRQAVDVFSTSARIDAASTTLDVADGGALDSEVDELAVWDRLLTDEEILTLHRSVVGWRAFGGEVYGKHIKTKKTARAFVLPSIGGSFRIDRSELTAAFATPARALAGDVARDALQRIGWRGTAWGCDLDTLVGRIVARGGSAADFLDRLKRAAEAIWWPDAMEDVHLDRAGATRHLDVTITEDLIQEGWAPRTFLEHYRTRTVARGGGISGGFTFDDLVGDGVTATWEPKEQVRSVTVLYVDGVETPVGSGEAWTIEEDGFRLRTTVTPLPGTPGNPVPIKLEYEIQSPLIAVAEDAAAINGPAGIITRTIEDDTIDTAEAIQELARVVQLENGQIPLELVVTILPRALPLIVGVGGSPMVDVRGINQRMVVQRLVTQWVQAGDLVLQTVTLRSHDLASGLDYYRQANRIRYPSPAPMPVVIDPHVVSNLGQRLPQPLGGDYTVSEASTSWVDVPGFVEVPINWAHFTAVELSCSFMSELYNKGGVGNRTARVRLRDITRGVTLAQERTVLGSGSQLYSIDGIIGPAGGGISRLRLQHRQVNAEVSTWGGELDVGI